MHRYAHLTATDLQLDRQDLNRKLAIAYQRGCRAHRLLQRRTHSRVLARMAQLRDDALGDFLMLNRGLWARLIANSPGGRQG